MASRLLLNLALALAVLAVAGGVLWTQQRDDAGLVGLDPDRVQRIAVEQREGGFVLERAGGQWWLTAPRRLPASELHVDNVLRLLRLSPDARYGIDELDPARVGLAAPAFQARFDGVLLAFGAVDAMHQRRYIRHGDEVLLVREAVSPLLGAPWWNFINRRLVPVGRQAVAVELPDGRVLREPAQLAAWNEAQAQIVQPEPVAAGEQSITLVLDSGERRQFVLIGGAPPRLLHRDSGLAYELPAELYAALIVPR